MTIPAVVTAGDQRAAKAVYGESKVFLEIAGRPLVAHVVLTLQRVPEVSEVWVVGDAERLREIFDRTEIRSQITKPLHILEQFRNLYENAWESYRRALPGAGPEGRDPVGDDLDQRILYVSGDLPFATPQEISDTIRIGLELDCDYALGLVTEESMRDFEPNARGEPGIHMACFNLREGRVRQSNLHMVKPARILNRVYIEKMYEARHQREVWDIVKLAWTLMTLEEGGPTILYYYALMHLAGLADRWGLRRTADRMRRWIPSARIETGCSSLLGTSFRFAITEVGGCAIDIDLEADYDTAVARFDEWTASQAARAARRAASRALSPPHLEESA